MKISPIGGMLFSYFLICPRKAWLVRQGIWMEQESEDVALGRLLDETSYGRSEKHLDLHATAPDGTPLVGKIDRALLCDGVLHETKKGRSCQEAHLDQRLQQTVLHRQLNRHISYERLVRLECYKLVRHLCDSNQDAYQGLHMWW